MVGIRRKESEMRSLYKKEFQEPAQGSTPDYTEYQLVHTQGNISQSEEGKLRNYKSSHGTEKCLNFNQPVKSGCVAHLEWKPEKYYCKEVGVNWPDNKGYTRQALKSKSIITQANPQAT